MLTRMGRSALRGNFAKKFMPQVWQALVSRQVNSSECLSMTELDPYFTEIS